MLFSNICIIVQKPNILRSLNFRSLHTVINNSLRERLKNQNFKFNNEKINIKTTVVNTLKSQFNSNTNSKRYIVIKKSNELKKKFRSTTLYFLAAGVFMVGATYAGVPLYRMYCQVLDPLQLFS